MQPTDPAAPATVVHVSEASFQVAVIDRSYRVPVVLELWTECCRTCERYSAVLEKLAVEGVGAWVLARVDVAASPRLRAALGVQGIPAVFIMIKGELTAFFQGDPLKARHVQGTPTMSLVIDDELLPISHRATSEAGLREFVEVVVEAGREAGLTIPAVDG